MDFDWILNRKSVTSIKKYYRPEEKNVETQEIKVQLLILKQFIGIPCIFSVDTINKM